MEIKITPGGTWYHGSPLRLDTLRQGSTVTQWKELAEAFSHKPAMLGYGEYGDSQSIVHNGTQPGYLYAVDEPVRVGEDLCQHPRTTMDPGAEFLTQRELRLRLLEKNF